MDVLDVAEALGDRLVADLAVSDIVVGKVGFEYPEVGPLVGVLRLFAFDFEAVVEFNELN